MFAPLYLSIIVSMDAPIVLIIIKIKRFAEKIDAGGNSQEVLALQDMGHKRLALGGEDPVNNPLEYILESIETIYSIQHKNGAIRRVNVNIAATTVENYKN